MAPCIPALPQSVWRVAWRTSACSRWWLAACHAVRVGDAPIAPLDGPNPEVQSESARSRRRALFASITVVVVVAIVAGFVAVTRSGEHSAGRASKTVVLAQITSATHGAVRFHLAVTWNGRPEGIGSVNFGGDGIADLDHKIMQLTVTVPSVPGGPNVGGRETTLYVGKHMYISADIFRRLSSTTPGIMLPGGLEQRLRSPKIKWIDVGFVTNFGDGHSPSPFGQNPDPSDLVESLRKNGVKVSDLGTATVRGVRTTHYRALWMKRITAPSMSSTSNSFHLESGRLAPPLTTSTPSTRTERVIIDLWAEPSHRLVQLATTTKGPGTLGSQTVTETFSNYDGPPLSPPKPDEVYTLSSISDITPSPSAPSTPWTAPPPPSPYASAPAKLDGPWSLVASGTTPVAWKVWHGTAHGGWQCFASEPTNVTDINETVNAPIVDGKHAWCANTTVSALWAPHGVELFSSPLGPPTVFMGLLHAGSRLLALHFADGTVQPLAVDRDGAFGWFGRGTPTSLTWIDAQGAAQRCGPTDPPSSGATTGTIPKLLLGWSCVISGGIPQPTG